MTPENHDRARDEGRMEDLLRSRGRRLSASSPFSKDVEAALRDELRAEAETEAQGAGRSTLTFVLGGLLLAAAALTLMNRVSVAHLFGRIEAQVAWLDVTGRPLGTRARSDQPADTLPVEALLVELVPTTDGYATVLFYDAAGVRWLPDEAHAWPLEAGTAWTGGFDVAHLGAAATVLVCLSERPLERGALEQALPPTLAGTLTDVLKTAEQRLGVRIATRSL